MLDHNLSPEGVRYLRDSHAARVSSLNPGILTIGSESAKLRTHEA